MNIREFSRFALIQTAFIGDVALALYLAQALRELVPQAEITFVTTPVASDLVRCSSAVNTTLAFDKRGEFSGWKGMKRFSQVLSQFFPQVILAPHRSLRTSIAVWRTKPSISVGFEHNSAAFLYSHRVPYYPHLHEAERNLHLLLPFGDVPQNFFSHAPQPIIDLPERAVAEAEILLQKQGISSETPFAIFAPGSVWATKRWTAENFSETALLFRRQGIPVLLCGSQADSEICSTISDASGASSLCGKTDIPTFLALIKRAAVVLSNDSSPTHFANLVQTPVITLFGATSPMFGFAPRGKNDRVLENSSLACRPCSIHGTNSCPIGTFECMSSITAPEVWRVAERIIREE